MSEMTHIEVNGVRLRRSVCGFCGLPVVFLGMATRIDLAEGGFHIVHCCWPCLRVIHRKEVLAA